MKCVRACSTFALHQERLRNYIRITRTRGKLDRGTPTEAGTVGELVGQIEAQKREVDDSAGEVESRKERVAH